MNSPTLHSTQSHSRLIRFLSELALVDFEAANRDFAERLGLLLNFADSILLSDALKAPAEGIASEYEVDAQDIRATFLRSRGQMVSFIVSSCVPGNTDSRIKWPAINTNEGTTAFDPFWKFYSAHQRDMELSVRTLRATVRDAIKDVSENLHHLVSLDVVLDDILWDHSRRFLAVVPRFLEKRFHWLQQQHGAKGWQLPFSRDLQGLLLAELDIRLQPVLGLVEALNHEVNKHDE